MNFSKIIFQVLVTFLFIAGCNSNEKLPVSSGVAPEQSSVQDDFSDLKPKEGGCTTEEDIKKKLEEESQKKKSFKLQGGGTDCKVN